MGNHPLRLHVMKEIPGGNFNEAWKRRNTDSIGEDQETMDPIEPPWQAIKEWIPGEEPDLDWFNRPRNPSNPDPDGFDQSPAWQAPEIQLADGRILVLEYT